MRTILSFLLFFLFVLLWSCSPRGEERVDVFSPDGRIQLDFLMSDAGMPTYAVYVDGRTVIDTSGLGFEFRDQDPLREGLTVKGMERTSVSETWEMPWGEVREVRNTYNELRIDIEERDPPNRQLVLRFRAYDDGVALRYEFPLQTGMTEAVIMDELTEFRLTGDHRTWWIPGDWDIYEHIYNDTRFSEIDAIAKRDHPNLAQTYIPENAVNTPVTMKTDDGLYLSFHEAALYDYAGMTLRVDPGALTMTSELVGSADGAKVKTATPWQTPWRCILIAEEAGDLIESKLIVNLNEPGELGNPDWIQPMKYAGIWWEMHLGTATWDMASGRHGATTENAKRYIDFCAENGIGGLLIEGWNTGWEVWTDPDARVGAFDFVTPYADYDLQEVVRYAREKGVAIIMHHETSAVVDRYEEQLDAAYGLMEKLGIHAVKTGYVGKIVPEGEYHHGQYMVNHYQRVIETAAAHQVMVDAHEPIKATGKRRTWPNMVTREGLRGQEFNAWSAEGGNPVDHLTTVAFTRMLAGPVDYTPGIFNLEMTGYQPNNRVKHTLAHELALYVVIYSPLQMVADLPQHYVDQPAFQFIRDVPVNWEETRVLNGEVSDYVTIARRERGTDNWFLGSITDETARDLEIPLDFLANGKTYRVTLYADADGTDWQTNPTRTTITQRMLTRDSTLTLRLAAGGGAAVSLVATEEVQ